MVQRLLYCAADSPEQARKGRWLNRLLLTFIALGLASILLNLILLQFSPSTAGNGLVVALLVALYLLNRRGFVTAATICLLVVLLADFIQAAFAEQTGLVVLGYPALFVLVIITAGIFLSWREVLATVGAACGITVWYYFYSNIVTVLDFRAKSIVDISLIAYTMLLLFIATGALSLLSSRLLGEALSDLRRRNGELETAYAELAVQSQREHTLGANIGDLAGQLSAVSARQASGVTAQAQSISQVVSVVAELHAAADQIAARADEVRQAADLAMHSVQRGQDLVLHSREAVQRNRAQVQMVIERMHTLGELSTRLTRFVNRIHGLSDETHLLALNATIEAAGAGPLGRRFGVVAAEVQNLSRRSNEIVDQIRALIEELQQAGQVTLAATQGSIAVADEVERLADEVRTAQDQVGDAVQRTTELVQIISVATGQQTSATAQMTQTMFEIAQVADATNYDTGALERAVAELIRAADMLNSAMTRVRIHPLV